MKNFIVRCRTFFQPCFEMIALKRCGPYLFFAGIVAFLLPEIIFYRKVFVGDNDRLVSEISYLHLAAQTLKHQALPFWNSYSFCGHTGLGLPNLRIFYPLTFLVAYLFPAHLMLASSWRIVLEIFLSLTFYYWFFKKVWQDATLALFSSLVCSISTFAILFWCMGYIPFYFPGLILWVLWDWPKRSMPLNILALCLALYLLISGSFYQYTAYFLLLIFFISLGRCLASTGLQARPLARLVLLWAAALVLALMLDSPDILAFLQDFRHSNRISVHYPWVFHAWAPPWYMVLRMLLPHFLGDHWNWSATFPLIDGNSNLNLYESFPAYAGIVTFLFATVAARKPFRRDTLPWLFVITLIALASLRTPFMVVPYLAFFKAPLLHGRLAVLIPLCMAFLAPTGVRFFLEGSSRFQRACILQFLAIIGIVSILASGIMGDRLSLYHWIGAFRWTTTGLPSVASRLKEASLVFLIGGVLVLLAAVAYQHRRLDERKFKMALVLLLALDLLYFARSHTILRVFRDEAGWYPQSELTRFLERLPDKDQYRFDITPGSPWADMPGIWSFNPNVNIPYGIAIVNGYANLIDNRYAGLASQGAGIFRGFSESVATSSWMADILAVKYIVTHNTADSVARYALFADTVFSTQGARVWSKRNALARWRLACKAVRVPDSLDMVLQTVRDARIELKDAVVLAEDEPTVYDWSLCRQASSGSLRMREIRPGLLQGHARLSAPALLVVTETFNAGWRATINGKTAVLHRANYAFQALELPAGDSEIELRYRTPGFGWSLMAVAAASAILLFLVLGAFAKIPSRS